MKYKNRLKRVADVLEKIGVAGIALAIFQERADKIWAALLFIFISIILTKES
ncbi:MAG: hypothetical protein J5838_02605 [Desulfovibrio sp.]|nr:hypothetical protein [Desulfovibrio sp.]